tara:strand:- start:540 stop:737 length:198 start_codon:yes stop_codon:yes gene_type:complete
MNQGMTLNKNIYYQGLLLGEDMTFNQGVAGSNPAGLTTFKVRNIRKTYPFQRNLVHLLTRESELK